MKSCIFFLTIFFCTAAVAQIKTLPDYPPVILPGSKLIQFKSAINSQDYNLAVQLPGSYKDSSTKVYPVLYLLDGQWSFAPTLGLLGGLNYDALVQEVIVVAIGWPDNYDANRARDLTPTKTNSEFVTGGGPAFLKVIKNEVRAFVNANYRSDTTNSILSGGSYGGLFALYALFNEPGLFKSYIIGSPSLDYDNNITWQYEKAFAASHQELDAKIFFHCGQIENEFNPEQGFESFVNQIKKRNYKGLQVGSVVVDKMSHASNGPYGVGLGLQFVLSSPDLVVDSKLLDQYVGKYEHDVEITREGDFLYLNLPGYKARFHAANDNLFYVPGLPGTGEFVKDSNGKVVTYCVRISGKPMFAKRLY
jgi:predicted alpha/beta superfamily hydrolase